MSMQNTECFIHLIYGIYLVWARKEAYKNKSPNWSSPYDLSDCARYQSLIRYDNVGVTFDSCTQPYVWTDI